MSTEKYAPKPMDLEKCFKNLKAHKASNDKHSKEGVMSSKVEKNGSVDIHINDFAIIIINTSEH